MGCLNQRLWLTAEIILHTETGSKKSIPLLILLDTKQICNIVNYDQVIKSIPLSLILLDIKQMCDIINYDQVIKSIQLSLILLSTKTTM